jgi:hypothetical protein
MLLAVVLFAIAALLLVDANAVQGGGPFGSGSSLEHGETGLSQARRYLAEVAHVRVESLVRPIPRAQLPANGVVFSIMPQLVAIAPRSEHRHHHHGKAGPDATDGSDTKPGSDAKPVSGGKPGSESTSGTDHQTDDQAGHSNQDGQKDHAGPTDHERQQADGHQHRDQVGADKSDVARVHPLLSDGEEAWIAGGGRLVLAVDRTIGELEIRHLATAGVVSKTVPALPGVLHLIPPEHRGLSGIATFSAAPVFVCGDAPVIMHQSIGRGDLWLLSCPEVLSNQHLIEADHLGLLTGLAAGRPVYFDEFAHGAEHDLGVTELLRRWNLGPPHASWPCWVWAAGSGAIGW